MNDNTAHNIIQQSMSAGNETDPISLTVPSSYMAAAPLTVAEKVSPPLMPTMKLEPTQQPPPQTTEPKPIPFLLTSRKPSILPSLTKTAVRQVLPTSLPTNLTGKTESQPSSAVQLDEKDLQKLKKEVTLPKRNSFLQFQPWLRQQQQLFRQQQEKKKSSKSK